MPIHPKKKLQEKKIKKKVNSIIHDQKKTIFPKEPPPLIHSKKYSIDEKDQFEKDGIKIHRLICDHWEYCDQLLYIKSFCEDVILDMIHKSKINKTKINPKIHHFAYTSNMIKKLIKKKLFDYQSWRIKDGDFIGSLSAVRCCAGYAHGWTAISRVFILESRLFSSLTYHSKNKILTSNQFTKEEIMSLIDKDHCILLFNKKPIHQWSAKMISLQIRLIAQRWNHMKNFIKNIYFRSAIQKLINQIQYRGYTLIENGVKTPDLQKEVNIAEEGVLSKNFNGKIICTPQNNCGMSSLTSKGSWLDNLILTISKSITKLQNTLKVLNKICHMDENNENGIYFHDIPTQFIPKSYYKTFDKFKAYLLSKTIEMLDSSQLQDTIVHALGPSLVGIDVLNRHTESFGTQTKHDNDYWIKSRTIAPATMCLWMDSYVRDLKYEYILNSELAKVLVDMPQIAFLQTFEILSKKEGNNDMGFVNKFFVRIEHIRNVYNIVMEDMVKSKIPVIIKVGANYIVKRPNEKTYFYCETIVESIFIWMIIMKHFNHWKIDNINFENIYKNLFHFY